jgi:hypothetical protein
VRIFAPGASVSQDLEPENIAVAADSRTAWVTLQENNALAVIDIRAGRITNILPLGYKPHFLPGHGFDASDRDGGIHIERWPVLGMYQPDGIAAVTRHGCTFLVTANEGSARDNPAGFNEDARLAGLTLGDHLLRRHPDLQTDAHLGRLHVTTAAPFGKDTADDGASTFDLIFSYGGRSMSVWSEHGFRVFDSGDDFERITAARLPDGFNSTDSANQSFDTRSDDKGPEPEGITVGEVDGRTYAFVGLERTGGFMIYDVTFPWRPFFVDYFNSRDFTATDPRLAGDLSAEGLSFLPARQSPTRKALLAVAYPVSGTVTIYEIGSCP